MKEFIINKYLSLKFEDKKTFIFVNNELFRQCKYLLLKIPIDEINSLDQINSIDEAELILDKSLEKLDNNLRLSVPSEIEFWGHCSNLQVWAENDYDTRLLHRNLAFPLLNKLAKIGDSKAKIVLKEEIAKRLSCGNENVAEYLINEGYINYLTHEEQITSILNPLEAEVLLDLERFTGNPIVQAGSRKFFDTGVEVEPFQQFLVSKKSVTALLIYWYDKPDKPLPKSISAFKNLEVLIYMGENITLFPESIKELKLLKKLYVSSETLEKFPNSIMDITGMEELSIGSPFLKEIPKNIGNLKNLKHFSIGSRIKEVPESISNLGKLERLNLSGNPLNQLPEFIFSLKSIKILTIQNIKLEKLSDSISRLENLEYLNIKKNKIIKISEVLLKLNKLKTLCIDQKDLTEESVKILKLLKKKGVLIL